MIGFCPSFFVVGLSNILRGRMILWTGTHILIRTRLFHSGAHDVIETSASDGHNDNALPGIE